MPGASAYIGDEFEVAICYIKSPLEKRTASSVILPRKGDTAFSAFDQRAQIIKGHVCSVCQTSNVRPPFMETLSSGMQVMGTLAAYAKAMNGTMANGGEKNWPKF